MNSHVKIIVRSLALSAAALVFLTLNHSVVRADEVNFTGSAGGCFGPSSKFGSTCTPSSTGQGQTSSLLGLQYHGSSFDVTTANGLVGVGNLGSPGSNFNNFGSFTLDSTRNDYAHSFTLLIAFTLPSGTTPGSGVFFAPVSGSVITTNVGGVIIVFDRLTKAQTFTFDNGTFDLTVNDVSITGGNGPVALTGFIKTKTAPVPEPATLVLLGTGLAGIAAKLRKRKRSL